MAPNPSPPHHLGETPFIILFVSPGFAQSLIVTEVVKLATMDREGWPSIRWVVPDNDSVIDCTKEEIPLVTMEVPFRQRGRIEEKYRVKVPSVVLVTDHGNLTLDIDHKVTKEQETDIQQAPSIDGFVSAARQVKRLEISVLRHIHNGPSQLGDARRVEVIGKRHRLAYWQGSPTAG